MDPLIGFLLLLLLIGFSAVLSASEIAFTSMDKVRLGILIRERPRKSKALQVLLDEPNSLLTTIAIANNFSNILASSMATVMTIQMFPSMGQGTVTLLATISMTVYVLIFGEITPKSFGNNNPEYLTLRLLGPIVALKRALTPLIWFFKGVSDALLRLFPKKFREREQVKVSEDQITMLLEIGEEGGLIEEGEVEMIRRIFEFDDLVVRQVMVPRTEVESIEVTASLQEVRGMVREEEHSRYPVYEEDPDNVIGILHVKNLLHYGDERGDLKALLRPPHFIPESKPINDLLRDFQQLKQQMAIVVDEYGGMSGIVTIEDILEEIVGEIHDEYDTPEEEIRHLGNDTYLVEGSTEIDHLNEGLALDLPTAEGTTISGLILHRLEAIPAVGESLTVNGTHLLVEDASDKEIHMVRLKIIPVETVEAEIEANP